MTRFVQIPLSELHDRLPSLRHKLQTGELGVCCTFQGEAIGFLIPVEDREQLHSVDPLKEEYLSFSRFRKLLPNIQMMMESRDVLNLTFHGRPRALFVAGRLQNHLYLPLASHPDLLIGGMQCQ